MAYKIIFEDINGKKYKTPVIEDTGGLYKRPNVLTDDDDYDFNRKNFKPLNLTKKKNVVKSLHKKLNKINKILRSNLTLPQNFYSHAKTKINHRCKITVSCGENPFRCG